MYPSTSAAHSPAGARQLGQLRRAEAGAQRRQTATSARPTSSSCSSQRGAVASSSSPVASVALLAGRAARYCARSCFVTFSAIACSAPAAGRRALERVRHERVHAQAAARRREQPRARRARVVVVALLHHREPRGRDTAWRRADRVGAARPAAGRSTCVAHVRSYRRRTSHAASPVTDSSAGARQRTNPGASVSRCEARTRSSPRISSFCSVFSWPWRQPKNHSPLELGENEFVRTRMSSSPAAWETRGMGQVQAGAGWDR